MGRTDGRIDTRRNAQVGRQIDGFANQLGLLALLEQDSEAHPSTPAAAAALFLPPK